MHPAMGPRRAEPRGVDLGPLRVPVAAVNGEPPPGVLFAVALVALLAAICAIPVLAAWWLL